jgi:hypothetical protein
MDTDSKLEYKIGKENDGKIKDGLYEITYDDGSYYKGNLRNNRRHLKGIMQYSNNDLYDGEWYLDSINGKGKMIFSFGDIYDGDWKNNRMNGTENRKY